MTESQPREIPATQSTIESVGDYIGLIAIRREGFIFENSGWNDRFGKLDPEKFRGYSSFIACSQMPEARETDPESPIALIHLQKPDETGVMHVKFKINKDQNDVFTLRRYDNFVTNQDYQEIQEAIRQMKDFEELEKALDEGTGKRKKIEREEDREGFSIVGQGEAEELLDLLKKIYSSDFISVTSNS